MAQRDNPDSNTLVGRQALPDIRHTDDRLVTSPTTYYR
ncbi:hypothetical protein HSB1_34000 [Halogranum salarium B-1]|uniref:Uncharacterized protein n=1 Tax=Halogranum salarium B-1 TaxID=1210908 RepID=J2ZY84_9EURY|nr:hypothetical protein HSB1_34000 [Halogranum salarium B-1]